AGRQPETADRGVLPRRWPGARPVLRLRIVAGRGEGAGPAFPRHRAGAKAFLHSHAQAQEHAPVGGFHQSQGGRVMVMPFIDYWNAVDRELLALYGIDTADAGTEPDILAEA